MRKQAALEVLCKWHWIINKLLYLHILQCPDKETRLKRRVVLFSMTEMRTATNFTVKTIIRAEDVVSAYRPRIQRPGKEEIS